MNGQTTTAKPYGSNLFLAVFFLVFAAGTAMAQVPVDEDGNPIPAYYEDDLDGVSEGKIAPATDTVLSSVELEALVGPVALYPDDLLAIVLPASTYPLEIVQAARFLERLESDSSLKPDEEWDESVVALLNYPDVVRMMDQDIDWTWRLGEAVISQQAEVIAAVEGFRDRAYAAGNLKTDENQTVTYDDGSIEIAPASDEIIYVPYYEPEEVVVYQPRPVYHYYPNPYPVYYYPYPAGYRFASGYFWGVTTAFSIGWNNHYLNVYHPTYWGHPYYGHTYYSHYYRRPSIGIYNTWYVNNNYRSSSYRYRDGDHWRPRTRAGSRQHEPRVRNRYYPPGDNDRRREHSAGRSQLDNRDNGRLNLGLRERSESDRNRVAASNNVRTGVATGSNSTRRNASTDRNTVNTSTRNQGNRTTTNSSGQTRVAGPDNRTRASTRNSRSDQDQVRTVAPRAEVQFRDRTSENRSRDSRNVASPSNSNRTSRPSVSSDSGRTVRSPAQNQGRVATAPGQSRATPQRVAPTARTTAPRASSPTVRQRAQSAPPPRASAPRASAPQQRAPRASAPQQRAPRASAPQQTAPRASAPQQRAPRASAPQQRAPRASAPQQRAPRASAPQQRAPSSSSQSSGRSSSGARQSQRSSSSSRPRNRSN